ncbi:uncharacterized protein At5g08430-like [Impatiens glandulifera]|uniref:uncharacterized protein At5g08430-like n=1 Tax=Impatiens glandulifera TaxID=253017 RepID=UPI001FB10E4B|nr:uncharacterized protein At5g08430-like [Impatiens glandulifera]
MQNSLDFSNRETFECLFLEYWVIIKKEENLTSEDLQSANTAFKNWNKSISSDSVLVESSESDTMSSFYSEDEEKEIKSPQVMKKSKDEASGSKNKAAKPKRKFIDWGSEALIEFLTSIGKQTIDKLSQYEVSSIVSRYISDNNLCSMEKKKKVLCDARLQSLFQKKTLNKNKIYDLLELHFAENIEVLDDEFWSFLSDEDDDGVTASTKKKRTLSTIKEAAETEEVQEEGPKSCFASIVEENIKLVFLMKSLVKKMLDNNESEAFDAKVIGCFVKIRSDPMDYSQKNRFQLVLITGLYLHISCIHISVNRIMQDDKMKVNLQASTGRVNIDLDVEKLFDGIFNKDEVDDLRNRVEDGSIPRPTVVDLDMKARSLHVEITNHAIERELISVGNLIDVYNEKGWREKLFVVLDRRELLKSPEEQRRMLETVPQVVAAPLELDLNASPTLNVQACVTLGSKEDNVSTPLVNGEMPTANEPEAGNVGENNETEIIYSDEDDSWMLSWMW